MLSCLPDLVSKCRSDQEVSSKIYVLSEDDKSVVPSTGNGTNDPINSNNNNMHDNFNFNAYESALSTEFGRVNINSNLNENDILGPDGTGLINFGNTTMDDSNRNQPTEIPLQPPSGEYYPTPGYCVSTSFVTIDTYQPYINDVFTSTILLSRYAI